MVISAKMWADDNPFGSLHKVEGYIRDFLAENPDKGYTLREIYNAVIPLELNEQPSKDYEPVHHILTKMYCHGQVNTIRIGRGISHQSNARVFRHRPGTKQFFEGPTPDDPIYPDVRSESERKPSHDAVDKA